MLLKMYTDNLFNELKTNIKTNFEYYKRETSFVSEIVEDYDLNLYNLEKEVEYPILNTSVVSRNDDKKQWEVDLENAIQIHKNFVVKYDIPLGVLSDERFIAYLTHDVYYDYMHKRWPIESKKGRIKEKYFLPSGSQKFTRNMFLRFFWYTYITYDVSLADPYELTRVAFEYQDPVNQIMERSYGKNEKITKAALRAIKNIDSKELNKKRTIFGKTINNILSLYSLDVMRFDDLVALFEEEINNILGSKLEDVSVLEEE